MVIGQRVYRLRIKRQLSQQGLAERAGFSQAIVSRLETCTQQTVTSDVLKGLAIALGCTADYLLGMYEDEDSDEQRTVQAPQGAAKPRTTTKVPKAAKAKAKQSYG